jgi:hypothetical protein
MPAAVVAFIFLIRFIAGSLSRVFVTEGEARV